MTPTAVRSALLGSIVCGLVSACSISPAFRDHNIDADENAEINNSIALMAGQTAAAGEYKIGPEDLLEVTLFDIEDNQGPRIVPVRVSNVGHVTLPFVGKVEAGGLSSYELERSLVTHYKKFIHDPQVAVFIKEYRSYQISIVGFVQQPGVFELRGRKSLLEGLAMAGGLNEDAGRNIRITRQTDAGIETALIDLERITGGGELQLNVALVPGDVINVPQAGTFYVEGMVNKPGAYPLQQPTTVSQAVATAGGADLTLANISGAVLLRKLDDGQREKIPVRLAAIRDGRAEDFFVQEDDVVVVPMSGAKYFFDRALGILRFDRKL